MKRNGNGPGSRKGAWLFVAIVTGLVGAGSILLSIEHKKSLPSQQVLAASSIRPGTPPNSAITATNSTNSASARSGASPFEQYRLAILNGRFGQMPIEELLSALTETQGGRDVQLIFQALALRKQEALPLVKEKLRTGSMWEKRMLTKFLGLCPWPETKDELLAVVGARNEHWLPRQGALYALGALGESSVGPEVLTILNSPEAGLNLQMAAMSTLSRIGFKDGAAALIPFAQSENVHLRLFAARAQAELGEPVDKAFLLSALKNNDYVARQEASEALWKIPDADVTEALTAIAKNDFNEAVRDAASQSLLRREIAGLSPAEKVAILQRALEGAGRLTALWILRTVLEEAGVAGRSYVETVAAREDFLGERSRAYLVLAEAKSR
jgi:hypothetical protein